MVASSVEDSEGVPSECLALFLCFCIPNTVAGHGAVAQGPETCGSLRLHHDSGRIRPRIGQGSRCATITDMRIVGVLLFTVGLHGCAVGNVDRATDSQQAPPGIATAEGEYRVVERVVDGDTIVLDGGEKVRLIGVDTNEVVAPETDIECYGLEASAYTKSLLPGGTQIVIQLGRDPTDRYGRTLAYVWRRSDGLFVNADLVARGYAKPLRIAPNDAYADHFASLARTPATQRTGVWGCSS